jgi:hypothetical protein
MDLKDWEELKEYLEDFSLADRLAYLKELLKKIKDFKEKGTVEKIKKEVEKEITLLEKEVSKDRSWQKTGEVQLSRRVEMVSQEDVGSGEEGEGGENLEEIASNSPVVPARSGREEDTKVGYLKGGLYEDFEGGYKKINALESEEEIRKGGERGVVDYEPRNKLDEKGWESGIPDSGRWDRRTDSEKIIKENEDYKRGKKHEI